jgi:aromatic ring-opening dioxygenase catalytic subunit (LigB family)
MFTQFQQQVVRSIAQQVNFSHFCAGGYTSADAYIQAVGAEHNPQSVATVLAWVDNQLQAHRIGKTRVLQSITV